MATYISIQDSAHFQESFEFKPIQKKKHKLNDLCFVEKLGVVGNP